jgi:cobalamin biosynthesis protein CobT
VLGFTNTLGEDDPMIWVFSDFNERISENDLVSRFDRASACLWENTDGDALAYAYAMLNQRKEKRKVLLVISDGDPAGRSDKGDIRQYTREVVKSIESANIDVYGIGLLHHGVEKYYKKHIVVSDVSQLTPAIINILDRSI